jgi:signal transduction histidine kinase
MALRLGVRFTFLGFVLTAAISLTGVLYGNTPSENPISERIVGMEFFMATLAVIFYLFVAVMEERKRAAGQLTAELRRASELLAASKAQDAAKSEFIAVFAHELRNPLAPIVSSLEILKLKGGSSDRTTAGAISIIEDRVQTIVRLLDDLLDVSRISRQSFKLQREEIDLRNCVHNSAASLRELVEKHGLAFEVSMPENPLLASADPIRIEQIIVNLLMNAVKYTPRGTIMLSVARDGDYAEIRVKDTGVGIAPEVIGGIFEPFASRREGTHIGMKAGLGIGLWLTKNLVSMHGGTIEAKSGGAGRGSEFIVRLPLEGVPSTVIHHVTPMQNTIEKTSKKILVVDDNEAAAKGLATLLEHVGNTVEIAYVGAEALEKVDIFNPDVVVLDIGLPDISGYEVAAALRKKGFTGSIIALTGYGQEEDKKKAAEAGFDHHLTKPVGIADLQAVLVHA